MTEKHDCRKGKHAYALAAALLALLLLLPGCGGGAAAPAVKDTAAARTAAGGAGTDLQVYCFSAGKADAFLLYTDASAVLIDCGEKGFGKDILAYMEEAGIDGLDYLIVTHFDKDHVGGAAKVINSVPVKNVLQSNCPKDSEAFEKYEKALDNAAIEPVTVRETLTFELDGVNYTVDPPRRESYSSDSSNNSSLIVSVQNGENSLLFTGDAQDARLEEFIAQNRTAYTFLKVPYHGHWQQTLPELLASVRPSYAVITSSLEEPESPETLKALAEASAETWLTRDGPVLVICDGRTMRVQAAMEGELAA